MTTLNASLHIEAPPRAVWLVLADLEAPPTYDPTVDRAKLISPETSGVGAAREIVFANGDLLRERVTTFDQDLHLDLYTDATTMPLRWLQRSYTLEPDGLKTRLSLQFEYMPKAGPIGRAFDTVFLRKRMTRVLQAGLFSIKVKVEGGRKPRRS